MAIAVPETTAGGSEARTGRLWIRNSIAAGYSPGLEGEPHRPRHGPKRTPEVRSTCDLGTAPGCRHDSPGGFHVRNRPRLPAASHLQEGRTGQARRRNVAALDPAGVDPWAGHQTLSGESLGPKPSSLACSSQSGCLSSLASRSSSPPSQPPGRPARRMRERRSLPAESFTRPTAPSVTASKAMGTVPRPAFSTPSRAISARRSSGWCLRSTESPRTRTSCKS